MRNEKKPLISIVMPLYNSSEYLKEAIDSILAQTVEDWEFIIVNEFGSDDGSREIVEAYAKSDTRFILVQNTERLQISASLNVGLKMAKGKYIARMDADDISLPKRLEKQVAFMEEHADIVMCGTQVETFGTNAFDWKLECDEKKLSSNILFYSPCVHPTIMIRKSLLEKYNLEYNKDYTASEDYDLFSRICEYGKVANLNKVLFRYRLMENNATYRNNDIGLVNYNEVMNRQFVRMGLHFNEEQIKLLSPHYSLKGLSGRDALAGLVELDLLLKKILIANERMHIYDRDALMETLHKRMEEAYTSMSWSCKNFDAKKAAWIYENSVFRRKKFYKASNSILEKGITPIVSVLMPVYNSEKYIMDTIWSVLEQSYTDFEFLILNEFGSNDDSVFIAKMFDDPRIQIVQNKTKLGLAQSLNRGIDIARGKYLARIDADDLADKDRFKLQVRFLEKNPEYGVCGSWQHHIGLDTEWIHRTNENHEDIKAELLYNCDLCHSTLMLRKEVFVSNKLYYDDAFAAEDYELWTRVVQLTKFKNLPQILGEYRVGDDNITAQKMDELSRESGEIVSRQLDELLGIHVPKSHVLFLSGWRNEFSSLTSSQRKKELKVEKELIQQIWDENEQKHIYERESLLKALNRRWKNIICSWSESSMIESIDDLLSENCYRGYEKSVKHNSSSLVGKGIFMKKIIKKMFRRPWRALVFRLTAPIMQNIWDLDGHVGDYSEKIKQSIEWTKNEVLAYMEAFSVQQQEAFTLLKNENNLLKNELELFLKNENNLLKNELELSLKNEIIITKEETKEKIDSKVWQAEKNILGHQVENSDDIKRIAEEVHRHIDMTYRDLMISLNTIRPFICDPKYIVHTDYPIAYESNDYKVPHGTVRDNTRYPRFILWCEKITGKQQGMNYMDLGCSGGGMVLDAALRGHKAIGLEGCDESYKQQRAEWRLLRNNLFTCDITKNFDVTDERDKPVMFDVISAWEVLEHIAVDDLDMLCQNIKKHLANDGYFVASIANYDDIDPDTGINWHVNQQDYCWWENYFVHMGFVVCTELITPFDLARGTINPSNCYERPYKEFDLNKTFYIVLKKNAL